MADLAETPNNNVSSLYSKLEESKSRLKDLNQDITKLTGRDPSENRSAYIANKRSSFENNNFVANSLGNRLNSRRSFDGGRDRFNDANRQRISAPQTTPNRRPNRDLNRSRDSDVVTPVRSKSGVSSSIVVKQEEVYSRSDELDKEAKSTSTDTKTRNKRMFGFLMGTLNQFKKDELQSDNKKEMRMQVEKRVEDRAVTAKKEERVEKMELFSKRKEEKKKLYVFQNKVELAELHESWDKGKRSLQPFIKTRYNPSIFYQPLNIADNKILVDLHKKSVARIEGEITTRRADFDSSIMNDDSGRNGGNERQEIDTMKIQRGNDRKRKDIDTTNKSIYDKNAKLEKPKSFRRDNRSRSPVNRKTSESEVQKRRSRSPENRKISESEVQKKRSRSRSHSHHKVISNGVTVKKEKSVDYEAKEKVIASDRKSREVSPKPIEESRKRTSSAGKYLDEDDNKDKLRRQIKRSPSSSSSSGSSDSSSDSGSNSSDSYSSSSSEDNAPRKRKK